MTGKRPKLTLTVETRGAKFVVVAELAGVESISAPFDTEREAVSRMAEIVENLDAEFPGARVQQ